MKTLIFSDSHLSNKVYKRKLAYLKSVIEQADKVIILGDFWDGFLTDFDGFIHSGWRELFPLLLERQAIYLYGNHDLIDWNDDRVSLFSVEQHLSLEKEIAGHTYYLTHGHDGTFVSLDERFPVLNHSLPLRIGATADILHKLVWGKRFLSRESKDNDPMRDWAAQHLDQPLIMVSGHSHYPEIDLDHRIINSGFIGCGYGNYVMISEEGIQLTKERYWRSTLDV